MLVSTMTTIMLMKMTMLALQVTRLTEEVHKAKRQVARVEERLQEAQGVKRFDPRMSFQPRPDKENSMVRAPSHSHTVRATPCTLRTASLKLALHENTLKIHTSQ